MLVYCEELCWDMIFGVKKLACYMCGRYSGYVSPYPLGLIYNIITTDVTCREGYGCRGKIYLNFMSS